ncbi:VOC family protein [Stutzerimonas stutzeri]|uniref:VOC family protein n=1 Tax=Stutzerimonas stutzeri TaxID=316 RepID=UPI0024B6B642|nr:VOC family protein [Stutzerimonas stutzeri]MDI9735662.1 VOC family protein [Stutzerimonas stutzeri]
MLNHVIVGSNDIERSKRFYDAVLGVLGAGEPLRNTAPSGHTRLFYRHDGSLFGVTEPINGEEATVANGGTTCEEPPGLRETSLGALHLSYVRDPDGNKLCAIYRPQ